MNILNLPNIFVLQGNPERHNRQNSGQHSSTKILNTCQAQMDIEKSTIQIVFDMLPIEDTYHAQKQQIIHITIRIGQQFQDIFVRYLKRRVIEVVSETDSLKSRPYEVSLMNKNNVSIAIRSRLTVKKEDVIKVCLVVCESQPHFKGQLSNVSVSLGPSEQQIRISNKGQLLIPSVSHPVQLAEIPYELQLLDNKICKKPHKIPKLRDGPKVLVCHDMKNGYLQDINEYGITGSLHNYRFHHWSITDIFVYFSHYNIAVPPSCWIEVCHSYNKLCLGTFIVEHDVDYTTQEVSDYLIHLACLHGFDGYLINIEYPVKDVQKFKKWLGQLKEGIHQILPGSILVFYDAIIHSGQLRYQSQLNQNNIDYLNLSDYFFTDYHWNMERLETGCAFAMSIDRLADVFIGNDVFGRGTYAGGQLNTYKAVKGARNLGFSIALFAQAYSYEVLGKTADHFSLSDDALFFGKSTERVKAQDDKWTITLNNGNGWKKEGQEWVTSFGTCQRHWVHTVTPKYRNQAAFIYFSVDVKGTPPKVNDPYRFLIELFADGGKILTSRETKKKEATENWQTITIQIPLLELAASAKDLQYVRVTEMGQDKQVWGGHYGTRFKNQSLVFLLYEAETDMSRIVGQIPTDILPFHSYYNVGLGKQVYLNGKSTVKFQNAKQTYNNMKDYDLPYQNKSIMSGIVTRVCYDVAWTGGSSLFVQCTDKNKTFGILPLLDAIIREPTRVNIKMKELQKHQYSLVCSGSVRREPEVVDVGSGWIELSFQVDSSAQLSLQIRSDVQDHGIWIGQLVVATLENLKMPDIKTKTYEVTIKEADMPKDLHNTYIDVLIRQQGYIDEIVGIGDSLTPLIKSTFVLINGQYAFSLYRKGVNFIQSFRVEDLNKNKVEIISVDRLGRQTSHNVMIYIL